MSSISLSGAESSDTQAKPAAPPKIQAKWVLEQLDGSASPELTHAVINALVESDELAPLDNASLKKILTLTPASDAQKKDVEERLRLTLKLLRLAAPAPQPPPAAPVEMSRRDIQAEPREKYELKLVRPAETKDGKVTKKPDYDWVRSSVDPGTPPFDPLTGEADLVKLQEWEKKHAKNHRISVAARAGYEVTHLPDVNGESADHGGAFFGIRYYSENLFRFGSPTAFRRDDPPENGGEAKPYFRPNRVGEVDMFIDLNYRSADVDEDKEGSLDNVSAVNFAGGLYMPLNANFPRAVLFDFTDNDPAHPESWARGEFGLIAVAGIKASLGDEAANDFQKFGAAGIRLATFRPTSPDPIRYIDLLLGGRTDFNNPRFRIESHYLLYEFKAKEETKGSAVNLYAFGAVEIDLRKDDQSAQDSLIIGAYLRYELDRIKSVFGSILP